ncbi:FG-GAP repeat domain-containing protein [Alloacidobacterium dinghuense]|uniref:FG-GAP repeat domain-containing protein n=1 Tax=Alloacidobacterium dinghuense TaxID=2763107 RepID=UPI0020366D69|nr:VCBS repeat-containing protein [Alloacidobacterium dinghuense]
MSEWGVAVGDYDNDGWPDLFVTAYGRCILYKNNHDRTFTDVTDRAGVATPGWTTSAAWFDYDNDGRLDLFVCSFVDYTGVRKLECGNNQLGRNYYCVPSRLQAHRQLPLPQQRRRHLRRGRLR